MVLVVNQGRASVRNKQGRLLAKEVIVDLALLPFGLTILDCVVPDTIQGFACCLYVMDVIYWDQSDMGVNDAECRHFWLQSRFSEISTSNWDAADTIDFEKMKHLPPLKYVAPIESSCEAIEDLYRNSRHNYIPDSLIFTYKQSRYWPGLSPLQLQWRDIKLSRYVIDTSDYEGDLIPAKQRVVLKSIPNGTHSRDLVTWDGVKVAEIKDEPDCLAKMVRCKIEGLTETGMLLGISDLVSLKSHRIFPDSMARIRTQAFFRKTGGEECIVDVVKLTQRQPADFHSF